MSSIFRIDDNVVNKPNRNVFDLSHQNNLTCNMGKLVPVLCQPVYPGDSVKIDPSFGLRYMPQVFPVQTRQRASIKFYYVRFRNLWKDWMDFIGKTKTDLTMPYIQFDENSYPYYLRPSSLLDYLGAPVKVYVPYGDSRLMTLGKPWITGNDIAYVPNSNRVVSNVLNEDMSILTKKSIRRQLWFAENGSNKNFVLGDIYGGFANVNDDLLAPPTFTTMSTNPIQNSTYGAAVYNNEQVYYHGLRRAFDINFPLVIRTNANDKVYVIFRLETGEDIAVRVVNGVLSIDDGTIQYNKLNGTTLSAATGKIKSIVGMIGCNYAAGTYSDFTVDTFAVTISASYGENLYWCDIAYNELPFATPANPQGFRLTALVPRAYQAVYNACIRNAENNPLIINGKPEYNKYIWSDEGGAEPPWNVLAEQNANWSDDRFTTALPSPQQGNAPLVGLTGVQGATLKLANENGDPYVLNLQVDSDTGNVVSVADFSDNTSENSLDSVLSAVEYGITINDLRNVNSLQRWLENNIRKGYKYKDQLLAHYGVNARYDVLDMPEFIGGVARDVNVSQITQTVENEYGNLGDYGGQSYVMGDGRSIEHYCDEHGVILGIMEIKPMPLYQDTLPKYFDLNETFDFFFPEFGKIGMQPIHNKEIAFSQSFLQDNMNGTFGYQRAWYDMVENLDSVHGLFRTDLRNFVMARDFADVPQLSPDFLTVDNDDLNNTFYSDDDSDKIIGQVYFHMSMKRPVPLTGIPAIE